MRLAITTLVLAAVLTLPASVQDDGLSAAGGPVILTVTGDLTRTNAGDAAEFDPAMLEDLPGRTTTIRTPWYGGPRSFSRPLLSAVPERWARRAPRCGWSRSTTTRLKSPSRTRPSTP